MPIDFISKVAVKATPGKTGKKAQLLEGTQEEGLESEEKQKNSAVKGNSSGREPNSSAMTLLAASEKKRRQKSPVKEAMMRGKFGEPIIEDTRNGRDSSFLRR